MTNAAIFCQGLSKYFGKHRIFDECFLRIAPGEVFGLVGLNGAGKTTLIRVLLGLLKPSAGTVTLLGHVPWEHAEALYENVGVVLDNDGFSGNMHVRDNLKIFASAKGVSWDTIEGYIKEFWAGTFIAEEVFKPSKKVKYFSRGQRMQCSICRAFIGWPKAFLFDEPTVALDVEAYDHFCKLCTIARDRQSAILISSHQVSAIEELCTSVGVLNEKKLRLLDGGAHGALAPEWTIVADFSENYKTIIEGISATSASYHENAWHFCTPEPSAMVPNIIEQLVLAGCKIREVGPTINDLKKKIRTHYEKA